MATIRPDQLPPAPSVNPAAAIVVDDGVTVNKATPIQVVDAAIPLASQGEAEAGTDNVKRVTPLRVAQAIDALGVSAEELASTAPGEGADLMGVQRPETGSTPQTAFEIMTRVVSPSPLSFGGKGDGVTDDTGAILETIKRTGRLFLPKATWLCDAEALVDPALEATLNGLNIFGEGRQSVLQFAEGGLKLSGNISRHSRLSNFRIHGTGTAQTLLSYEDITVNSAPTRWVLDNVELSSNSISDNVGLYIRGGWIGSIYNPIIRGFKSGVLIEQSEDGPGVSFNGLNVYGGEIQGNSTGLDVEAVLNLNFFGTAIEGNRRNGIILRDGCRSVSFKGVYFEANGIAEPATTNDIRIETVGPLSSIYSVLVDSGCTFLRGGSGSETAIWANKCQALIIEDGAAFNGYDNTLDLQDLIANGTTGANRSRSTGNSIPWINNTNNFGDPKNLVAAMAAFSMPPAADTSSPEMYLTLPAEAGRLGEVIINYSADAAGDIRFRVFPFDVATGAAITTLAITHTAVEGRNIATGTLNFDSRAMRGITTAIQVTRQGTNEADTNAGAVALQSIEIKWAG